MLNIVIKTTHDQYPELAKREIGEATRAANRAMADAWVKGMLPDHFSPAAHFKYGYAPRTKRYLRRKIILASRGIVMDGGKSDLVFTGAMRRRLTQIYPLIKAFPTRAMVTLFGPPYFTDRPRNLRKPNMGKEVQKVTSQQNQILAGRADQAFNERAQRIKAGKTIVFR